MNAGAEVVLRMRGIEKAFGPVVALSGVDLEVRRGEVHALIGENGAGKSTLMKVLSGAHHPDAGTITLGSEPYHPKGPLEARRLGVAMIYQELTLSPHLSVAENIMLGRESARLFVVDRESSRKRVNDALAFIGSSDLTPDTKVSTLSPGARQLVEVARALAFEARVVVMDEPTSSLTRQESERLFEVIERLSQRGVAVIYISHFLEEVRRVSHRYTVLRDGKSVAFGDVPRSKRDDAGFRARVIEAMAGRKLEEAYPRVPHTSGEEILRVEQLSGTALPLSASFSLARGQMLGIAGLIGAGRTELLRAIFGLDAVKSGRIRVATNFDGGASPHTRLSQGVGLLSENRKEEGLALNMSIADNVTLSRPIARGFVLSQKRKETRTRELGARIALKYRAPGAKVSELSGGNQQKVALLRLLHHDVDVFLLDEPTRGIDVGSKAEIYQLLGELLAKGKAIVFVSSYLPELLGVCDQIAVMTRGKLSEARPASSWSESSLLEAATHG